jgi:hypothetical protein
VTAGGAAASPVNLSYYDGNPSSGGVLFGYQSIPYIAADSDYLARYFYQPATCGDHNIYVTASSAGSASTVGFTKALVTIQPAPAVQAISKYVSTAGLPDHIVRDWTRLLAVADYFFNHNDDHDGILILQFFNRLIESERGKSVPSTTADSVISQTGTITGCLHQVNKSGNASQATTQVPDSVIRSLIARSGVQLP